MTPELGNVLVILLVGSLIAGSCALVGCYLVLRRLALLGDAISHAVLPGIAVAFLLTGNRSPLPMFLGAAVVGVLTVVLVRLLHGTGRLVEDASIGVVFPALFSIGVILISRYASRIDLDLDCVLYGEIAYAPWDLLMVGDVSLGPKPLWVAGSVFVLNLLLVLFLYKELEVTSFDPALAASLGISPILLHYVLMSAVSVTVVGSFESVGAILVVAMLVVPPATAYLLCRSLKTMLVVAVALGVLSAVLGYGLARSLDCSIAGAMATVTGGLFAVAVLASPGKGVVAQLLSRRILSRRLDGQLLLLHLGEGASGLADDAVLSRFGWSPRRLRRIVARLEREGSVEARGDGLALTRAGARALEELGTAPLAHRPE